MRIVVYAKPGSNRERVDVVDGDTFVVSVKALPIKGRANNAIIKAIAKHYGIAQSDVTIVAGQTSQRKVLEVLY